MIWALLEITLPLCLSFLMGITGGWLFWRWRRRYVSASEWNAQSNDAELRLLRDEHAELKITHDGDSATIKSLESKIETQTSEMRALELTTQKLNDELKAAKKPEPEPLNFEQPDEIDKLKTELAAEKRKTAELDKLKADLAAEKKKAEASNSKVVELSSRTDSQTQLNNELQQKLKQSESVAVERDAAIERLKDLELKQSQSRSQELELSTTKEQLVTVQNKFKNFQASVVADRQSNDQQNEKLQARITELESELNKQDKLSATADEHKKKITELESQLIDMNRISAELTQANKALAESEQEKSRLALKATELDSELRSAAARTQASIASDKEKLASLEKELAEAERTRSQSDRERSDLASKVADLESKLRSAGQQAEASRRSEREKLANLEQQLVQANNAAAELTQTKANISTLNTQLNEARMAVAQQDGNEQQLMELKTKINELHQKNVELSRQIQQADATKPESRQELRELQRKYAEVAAQLNDEKKRNAALTNKVSNTADTPKAEVTPITAGQLKRLKKQISNKDEYITELEKKLKNKSTKRKKQKASWQKGKTKIGTPGSDHRDDLTAINGIGPKIEKVLNKLGIKSWEQLATLRASEVTLVDETLVDFPGRIKRDEWVSQAKAIMRNGHQPPGKPKPKSTKKPKRAKTNKKAWQQGKTRFGTPGSKHRDDLKVVNGIGPVIEKALNRRGIRSWEQLAALTTSDVKIIDEALNFPGRITREQWVQQAKSLIKQFPDHTDRPKRTALLNKVS